MVLRWDVRGNSSPRWAPVAKSWCTGLRVLDHLGGGRDREKDEERVLQELCGKLQGRPDRVYSPWAAGR